MRVRTVVVHIFYAIDVNGQMFTLLDTAMVYHASFRVHIVSAPGYGLNVYLRIHIPRLEAEAIEN